MPETSTPPPHEVHHPATVGSTFMRQYYHLLAKDPASLHRFYKDESTWCHGVGSHMQDAISGQKAINAEILRRGYDGARVDLDAGSIDCQASLNGGVFVLVTGVMTLKSSPAPKPFVQTFFLAVQPKGYFVLNDCLRFLELPGASPPPADASVAVKDAKKPTAIGTPAAVASPVSKPATPVAKKEQPAPSSPAAKPVEAPPSPVKVKSPVKVASPKAAAPAPAPAPAPASPVKKAPPAEEKTAPKPSETKPATPASPVAAKAPAKPAAAPATPAEPAAPAAPAAPPAPPAPKTWAALFSSAPAAAAPPAPKPVAPAAPKPAPASPAVAAEPKQAEAASQDKEKKRLFSLYIRDVPAQAKDTDLRELFKSYGSIANVTVPMGRGFAFVDFYEEESMRAVLADKPEKEFKVHDKVITVDERTERKDKDRSGFRQDNRGGRGGRGAPKSGRTGDKERRFGEGGTNGKPAGDRRDKGGRRSGKEGGN